MEESRFGELPTARAHPRLVLTPVREAAPFPGACPDAAVGVVRPLRVVPPAERRSRNWSSIREMRLPAASRAVRERRALGVSVVVGPVVGATVVIAPRMVAAARRWTSRRSSPAGGGGRGAAR